MSENPKRPASASTAVIYIIGAAFGRSELAGHYLKSYDPEAAHGRGHVTGTRKLWEAKRYASVADALAEVMRQPECHPIRETDGRPNRPLTAFTIEVITLETLQ